VDETAIIAGTATNLLVGGERMKRQALVLASPNMAKLGQLFILFHVIDRIMLQVPAPSNLVALRVPQKKKAKSKMIVSSSDGSDSALDEEIRSTNSGLAVNDVT
jgi:hypothetical protein